MPARSSKLPHRQPAATVLGGNGGGRPDMAQAGGKEPEKLADALKAGVDAVRGILG